MSRAFPVSPRVKIRRTESYVTETSSDSVYRPLARRYHGHGYDSCGGQPVLYDCIAPLLGSPIRLYPTTFYIFFSLI